MATVLLAISTLLKHDTLIGLKPYAPYAFVFFSVLAATESFNSLNLKDRHRAFLVGSSLVIVLFGLMNFLSLPFQIPRYPFAILYVLMFAYFYLKERNKIKSRLGILVIWLAMFISWLIPSAMKFLDQI